MNISLDIDRCKKCGKCIERMKNYCIKSDNGYPVFDEKLCNTCQKCVAICPFQAIKVNNIYAEKIDIIKPIDPNQFESFLERRRSIKKFTVNKIPYEILHKIIGAAKYSPNQNKNISVLIITDRELINEIDKQAVKSIRKLYKIMFGIKIVEWIISLIYKDIQLIKAKMEHSGLEHVVYENAQAIILVLGDKKIAVTESSSHYMLSSMMYMAEVLGIGTCLMDSLKIAFQMSKGLRRNFKIRDNVLGAMILGYSDENIINIPKGYEVKCTWNI